MYYNDWKLREKTTKEIYKSNLVIGVRQEFKILLWLICSKNKRKRQSRWKRWRISKEFWNL